MTTEFRFADMPPYKDVKAKIFAYAWQPNGYFGDTILVGLALWGKKVLLVHDSGYHTSPLPDVASESEALWLARSAKYKHYFRDLCTDLGENVDSDHWSRT